MRKTLENFHSRRQCEVASEGPQIVDRAREREEGGWLEKVVESGEEEWGKRKHEVAFDFSFVLTVAGDRLLAAAHQKQKH